MNSFLAIMMGMTLSLGIAVAMERALFRMFLKAMVVVPRRMQYRLAESQTNLRHIRRAGL